MSKDALVLLHFPQTELHGAACRYVGSRGCSLPAKWFLLSPDFLHQLL